MTDTKVLAKCTQCGECCKNDLCRTISNIFPSSRPPCRFLVYRDNKYWCGLVEQADKLPYGELIRNEIGIGAGCDELRWTHKEELYKKLKEILSTGV